LWLVPGCLVDAELTQALFALPALHALSLFGLESDVLPDILAAAGRCMALQELVLHTTAGPGLRDAVTSVSALPAGLRVLDLAGDTLDVMLVPTLLQQAAALRTLRLSIERLEPAHLQAVLLAAPGLCELALAQMDGMTPELDAALAAAMPPTVRHLRLDVGAGPVLLDAVLPRCGRWLRQLVVGSELGGDGVALLAQCCPDLEVLDALSVTLDAGQAEALVRGCPRLHKVKCDLAAGTENAAFAALLRLHGLRTLAVYAPLLSRLPDQPALPGDTAVSRTLRRLEVYRSGLAQHRSDLALVQVVRFVCALPQLERVQLHGLCVSADDDPDDVLRHGALAVAVQRACPTLQVAGGAAQTPQQHMVM
jgi:hypothetical protein